MQAHHRVCVARNRQAERWGKHSACVWVQQKAETIAYAQSSKEPLSLATCPALAPCPVQIAEEIARLERLSLNNTFLNARVKMLETVSA